mgnify:CR=1 FL=1
MSENNENNTSTQIASLSNDNEYYGKSLLQDSMERLARNRLLPNKPFRAEREQSRLQSQC